MQASQGFIYGGQFSIHKSAACGTLHAFSTLPFLYVNITLETCVICPIYQTPATQACSHGCTGLRFLKHMSPCPVRGALHEARLQYSHSEESDGRAQLWWEVRQLQAPREPAGSQDNRPQRGSKAHSGSLEGQQRINDCPRVLHKDEGHGSIKGRFDPKHTDARHMLTKIRIH